MAKATRTQTATRLRIRAAAIHRLESKEGRLTAESLIQAAKNPKHPMHQDFLWDDAKAGHQHRLNQARLYIGEVRFIVQTSTAKIIAPAYLRDRDVAPLQGYVATRALRTSKAAASETLMYEIARAQALFERCREIAAALELEEDIDTLLNATRQFASRLRMGGEPTGAVAS